MSLESDSESSCSFLSPPPDDDDEEFSFQGDDNDNDNDDKDVNDIGDDAFVLEKRQTTAVRGMVSVSVSPRRKASAVNLSPKDPSPSLSSSPSPLLSTQPPTQATASANTNTSTNTNTNTSTTAHDQQQQQSKQPPFKKRKVSLSPTDSLARHNRQPNGGDQHGHGHELEPLPCIDLSASPPPTTAADRTSRIIEIEYAEASRETPPKPASTRPPQKKITAKKQKSSTPSAKTKTKTKTKTRSPPKPVGSKQAKRTTAAAAAATATAATTTTKESKKTSGKPAAKITTFTTATETKTKPVAATNNGNTHAATATADGDAAAPSTNPPTKSNAKAATKPKQKKKKAKRTTFEDELLQKMFLACRPYSTRDLIQLMGKTTSEASVRFCLLSHIDKKWVLQKTFESSSKNRTTKELYWANQDCKDPKLWARDCLQLPSRETIREARSELAALQKRQKTIARDIATVEQAPSNDELEARCRAARGEVAALRAELDAVKARIRTATSATNSTATNSTTAGASAPSNRNRRSVGTAVGAPRFGAGIHRLGVVGRHASANANANAKRKPPAAAAAATTPLRLKKRINAMREEWKTRKRKCMDFVDQLADGLEKKVGDVVRKVLELETDEAVNAKLPPKHAV